jgi:hypothetical protein
MTTDTNIHKRAEAFLTSLLVFLMLNARLLVKLRNEGLLTF